MGAIRDTYLRTKKSPDLPWNEFVCRPVAAIVVVLLRGTRVTPNQVTLSALLVALVAAVLLVAWPGHGGLVMAIVVFELSYVLDCADGMLARDRGMASPQGHLFDFLMDEIKAFAILGASAIRLWLEHGDPRFLLGGIAGLVALASGIGITTFVRRPEIAGPSPGGPLPASRGVVSWLEGAARFVGHYPSYIWIAALANRLEVFLVPYVLVHALHALRSLVTVARRFGRA